MNKVAVVVVDDQAYMLWVRAAGGEGIEGTKSSMRSSTEGTVSELAEEEMSAELLMLLAVNGEGDDGLGLVEWRLARC